MLVKSVFFSSRSSMTFSIQIFLCPLCFSFPPHVHVKLHLVVFSPPSVLRVQTTVVFFCIYFEFHSLGVFIHSVRQSNNFSKHSLHFYTSHHRYDRRPFCYNIFLHCFCSHFC